MMSGTCYTTVLLPANRCELHILGSPTRRFLYVKNDTPMGLARTTIEKCFSQPRLRLSRAIRVSHTKNNPWRESLLERNSLSDIPVAHSSVYTSKGSLHKLGLWITTYYPKVSYLYDVTCTNYNCVFNGHNTSNTGP